MASGAQKTAGNLPKLGRGGVKRPWKMCFGTFWDHLDAILVHFEQNLKIENFSTFWPFWAIFGNFGIFLCQSRCNGVPLGWRCSFWGFKKVKWGSRVAYLQRSGALCFEKWRAVPFTAANLERKRPKNGLRIAYKWPKTGGARSWAVKFTKVSF